MILRSTLVIALCVDDCCRPSNNVTTSTAPEPVAPSPAVPVQPAVGFRLLAINFETLELADASGFFISPDGLAVTSGHVVRGDAKPLEVVLSDGRRVGVTLVALDEAADLALLRVDGEGPFPFLSTASRLPTSSEPLWTVTKRGIGEGAYRELVVDEDVGDAIELSTDLGPGASGGAVVDAGGRLIGVIRGSVDGEPAHTIAVPARRLAERIATQQ